MYSAVLTTGIPAPGRNDSNLSCMASVILVYERAHSLITSPTFRTTTISDVRARLDLKALEQ